MLAYEELKGASGREIWFRPPRYDARKLFPTRPPRVRVRSAGYQLHDISLSGFSVITRSAEDELQPGEIAPMVFQQAGLSIFEGNVRVRRKETTIFGAKIAFSLEDSYFDFSGLLRRNVQAQLAANSNFVGSDRNALVPGEYRGFCSEVLGLLRSYRSLLDQHSHLAVQLEHGFDDVGAIDACQDRFIEQWRTLWFRGNEIVKNVMDDPDRRQATKEFTELVLTPEMRLGAIWDRSYAKPFGYPGDFRTMNQVYSDENVGNDVYAKLLHRLGLHVAECIATRMEVVREHIRETVHTRGQERPARILSLGSGPAREVEQFLSGPLARAGRSEFTLVDQESEALAFAYDRAYPLVLKLGGMSRVQCLNLSFTDILRANRGLSEMPQQDMIYSLGLLDYLSDRRCSVLVSKLYETLAPGGLLVLGNMNETPFSNLWPMEFVADWTLAYRGDAEMRAWAEPLRASECWTETERTGRVRLLYIRKP